MGTKGDNIKVLFEKARGGDVKELSLLTRAFTNSLRLSFQEERSQPFNAQFIEKLLDNLSKLIREIEKIENDYWKSKAVEMLSRLMETIYTTRNLEPAVKHLEIILHDFEGISGDQDMVKRLRDITRLLGGVPRQTAIESPRTNDRKFRPVRKKRGGCNGSSSGGGTGGGGGGGGTGGGTGSGGGGGTGGGTGGGESGGRGIEHPFDVHISGDTPHILPQNGDSGISGDNTSNSSSGDGGGGVGTDDSAGRGAGSGGNTDAYDTRGNKVTKVDSSNPDVEGDTSDPGSKDDKGGVEDTKDRGDRGDKGSTVDSRDIGEKDGTKGAEGTKDTGEKDITGDAESSNDTAGRGDTGGAKDTKDVKDIDDSSGAEGTKDTSTSDDTDSARGLNDTKSKYDPGGKDGTNTINDFVKDKIVDVIENKNNDAITTEIKEILSLLKEPKNIEDFIIDKIKDVIEDEIREILGVPKGQNLPETIEDFIIEEIEDFIKEEIEKMLDNLLSRKKRKEIYGGFDNKKKRKKKAKKKKEKDSIESESRKTIPGS
jgi:hypothetical protein